jgi:hypothetical protein
MLFLVAILVEIEIEVILFNLYSQNFIQRLFSCQVSQQGGNTGKVKWMFYMKQSAVSGKGIG